MKYQRGFLETIIIVLVLSATLLGAYLYFKNTDKQVPKAPTSEQNESLVKNETNWKTYTSTKYNFEIDYPQNWQVELSTNAEGFSAIVLSGPNGQGVAILPNGLWEKEKPLGSPKESQITFKGLKAKELRWENFTIISILDKIPNWSSLNRIEYSPTNDTDTTQVLNSFKLISDLEAQGKICGGIAANLPEYQCPDGYICKKEGSFPDASGTCQKIN